MPRAVGLRAPRWWLRGPRSVGLVYGVRLCWEFLSGPAEWRGSGACADVNGGGGAEKRMMQVVLDNLACAGDAVRSDGCAVKIRGFGNDDPSARKSSMEAVRRKTNLVWRFPVEEAFLIWSAVEGRVSLRDLVRWFATCALDASAFDADFDEAVG